MLAEAGWLKRARFEETKLRIILIFAQLYVNKRGTGLAFDSRAEAWQSLAGWSLGIFQAKSDPTDHQTRSTHACTPTPSLRNWDGSDILPVSSRRLRSCSVV